MINLPETPRRIQRLRRDERGYPVPQFVQWMRAGQPCRAGEGEPDFRIADERFRLSAFKHGYCWICGDVLGVHRVYAIGPMCVINRTTSEPASHRDCAEFAVKACPFLVRPRMRRLPQHEGEQFHSAGIHLDRNPGCTCLYETREARAFNAPNGWLIRLGPPDRVDWWAEGRKATRAEIEASISSGYPFLMDMARKEGNGAPEELVRVTAETLKLLPAA